MVTEIEYRRLHKPLWGNLIGCCSQKAVSHRAGAVYRNVFISRKNFPVSVRGGSASTGPFVPPEESTGPVVANGMPPWNVWKRSQSMQQDTMNYWAVNWCLLVGNCAMWHHATRDNWPLCSCRCSTGMYYEGAGGEVQAAGSSGGSHAEGAEVPPTTEGTRHLTTAVQSYWQHLVPQREHEGKGNNYHRKVKPK